MEVMCMKLSKIKPNPNNPRLIKDGKFKKLCQSIKDFPQMMELRPIVVDDKNVILGGNMRFRACKENGMKDIPDEWVKKASDLTEEQKKHFIISDNVGFGDWDFDDLANDWDEDDLFRWGVDIPDMQKVDEMDDGDEIELEQSVQIEPPMEYILIMAEPNSEEWEEIKEFLKLKMVRRGGYKKGSKVDSLGLERVIKWQDFRTRAKI